MEGWVEMYPRGADLCKEGSWFGWVLAIAVAMLLAEIMKEKAHVGLELDVPMKGRFEWEAHEGLW